MSRRSRLKQNMSIVNKKYGNVIRSAHRMRKISRISTGSLELDWVLGGGLPIGRASLYTGQYSSGKTTNALMAVAQAQKLCSNCFRVVEDLKVEFDEVESYNDITGELITDDDDNPVMEKEYYAVGTCDCYKAGLFEPRKRPNPDRQDGMETNGEYKARVKEYDKNSFEEFKVMFVDVEGSLDLDWTKGIGVDVRRLLHYIPDSAESAIDVIDNLYRSGDIDMCVVDSIAALTPTKEITESVDSWQQGLQARLMNKAFRKWQSSVNAVATDYGKLITQIWINQLREKIGVMFGKKTTKPGGKGQEFAASIEVVFYTSNLEKERVNKSLTNDDAMEDSKSIRINFKCEKNKTSKPKRSGSYVLDLGTAQVDEFKVILGLAEQFGTISKENGIWKFGNKEFKTQKAMKEYIQVPNVLSWLRTQLIEKM